jgi:hypothetical protein
MSAAQVCAACGEDEQLHGEPVDGDIAVTCLSCGATWMRGAARCNTCGGQDIVSRPQPMSRHPRGNQLAIIGWRELPLCQTCDAEVLTASLASNRPVPEGYVSACLFTLQELGQTQQRRPAPTQSGSGSKRPSRDAAKSNSTTSPSPLPQHQRAAPARRTTPSAPPTLRQAIEAYLSSTPSAADSVTLLMLGSHLGPSTRLNELDASDTPGNLTAWFMQLWDDKNPDRRAIARSTVLGAIDYWRSQDWIHNDAGAGLR